MEIKEMNKTKIVYAPEKRLRDQAYVKCELN